MPREATKERYPGLRCLLATARYAAVIFLKNCIKVAIGRQRRFNDDGLFLRQYLLHIAGIRPIRKITCARVPGEGAGSQAFYVMNAIALARALGLSYVHTPFSSIYHADRPMEQWVAAWESLFNLGVGEAVCDTDRRDVINLPYAWQCMHSCLDLQGREDELARHFGSLVPEFRRRYYLKRIPLTTENVTVAVHVRRGADAGPDRPDYFTSNETILRTIRSVNEILDRHIPKFRIRVYSRGRLEEFEPLRLPGIEFFLDADPVWTLQEMIEADILIMAKGCYSYSAGLISDGIKIFEPRETPVGDFPGWRWLDVARPQDWVPCASDGTVDSAAFERQLKALIQSKTSHKVANEL